MEAPAPDSHPVGARYSIDLVRELTNYMVMIKVNIHEAKARLSEYLTRAEEGEVVVICRRNVPVAELRGMAPRRARPRPVGLARGLFEVPDDFQDPLPASLLDDFEGRGGT